VKKKKEKKFTIYLVTDDEDEIQKKIAMTEEERKTQPLVWKVFNANHVMKKATRRIELGREFTINSNRSFRSYGKTWFFSFSPITGDFDFYFLEEDDDFFATFTVEVGETIFEQKTPLKFDRGVSYGVRLNNTSGTRTIYSNEKNGQNEQEVEITPRSIIKNDILKFIVTIFPCSETGENL
jgi:hypothetical protein